MPVGTVEFWMPGRSEGALLAAGNQRLRFTARDLAGLSVAEIRRGLEVAFDPGPEGHARNVRLPLTSLLEPPADLPKDHPLLSGIPLPRELREILGRELRGGCHPGLRLDKYLVPAADQEQQKLRLGAVA